MDQGNTVAPEHREVTPGPHTPLPWFKNRKLEIGPRPRTDDQHDGMLHPVAEAFGDNRDADAAFIVRAANNHYALAEALEDCRRVLAMMVEPNRIIRTSSMQAWSQAVSAERKARAALSAAKGET